MKKSKPCEPSTQDLTTSIRDRRRDDFAAVFSYGPRIDSRNREVSKQWTFFPSSDTASRACADVGRVTAQIVQSIVRASVSLPEQWTVAYMPIGGFAHSFMCLRSIRYEKPTRSISKAETRRLAADDVTAVDGSRIADVALFLADAVSRGVAESRRIEDESKAANVRQRVADEAVAEAMMALAARDRISALHCELMMEAEAREPEIRARIRANAEPGNERVVRLACDTPVGVYRAASQALAMCCMDRLSPEDLSGEAFGTMPHDAMQIMMVMRRAFVGKIR